jgi:hypothetical protein
MADKAKKVLAPLHKMPILANGVEIPLLRIETTVKASWVSSRRKQDPMTPVIHLLNSNKTTPRQLPVQRLVLMGLTSPTQSLGITLVICPLASVQLQVQQRPKNGLL